MSTVAAAHLAANCAAFAATVTSTLSSAFWPAFHSAQQTTDIAAIRSTFVSAHIDPNQSYFAAVIPAVESTIVATHQSAISPTDNAANKATVWSTLQPAEPTAEQPAESPTYMPAIGTAYLKAKLIGADFRSHEVRHLCRAVYVAAFSS